MCCYLENVCVYVYEYVYGQMCICNNVLEYVLLPGECVCVCL